MDTETPQTSAPAAPRASVFVRVLSGFAAVATFVQLGIVLLFAGHYLTVDGNTLRVIAFVVAFLLAIGLPGGVALLVIRTLEKRGFKPRRGALTAGLFALLNGLVATGLIYGTSAPMSTLWSGSQRLLWGEADAVEPDADAQPDDADPPDEGSVEPVAAPSPKGAKNPKPAAAPAPPTASGPVTAARKSIQAVLAGNDPRALPAALTEESAAALGVVWMRFLSAEYGAELEMAAGAEVWARAHADLPDRPDLWADAAAIEPVLVPRGRVFLGAVMEMADAVVVGRGTGPMTWPILPDAVVSEALRHPDGGARYDEVAMNRVEVTIGARTYDVRYEDHGWRVDLGRFDVLCEQAPSARTLAIALRP
jgi:hypothetical protein